MNIRKLCFSMLCMLLVQCGCLSAFAQERLGVRTEQQTAAEADAAERAESFRRIFPAVRNGQAALDAARQHTLRFPAQRPQDVAGDEAGTLVYGSLIGGSGWGDDTPYGIYSFPAASGSPVQADECHDCAVPHWVRPEYREYLKVLNSYIWRSCSAVLLLRTGYSSPDPVTDNPAPHESLLSDTY